MSAFAAIATQLADLHTRFSLREHPRGRIELPVAVGIRRCRSGRSPDSCVRPHALHKERGVEGYVITLSRSLVQPFLTWSTRVVTCAKPRGARGLAGQKHPVATTGRWRAEILALPAGAGAQPARLRKPTPITRSPTAWAGSASAVHELLGRVWEQAKAKVVERERQALWFRRPPRFEVSRQMSSRGTGTTSCRKCAPAGFALDDAQVKPYFSLDAMLNAMSRLRATPVRRADSSSKQCAPPHHPDVRLWEVRRGNERVGLFLGDNFSAP